MNYGKHGKDQLLTLSPFSNSKSSFIRHLKIKMASSCKIANLYSLNVSFLNLTRQFFFEMAKGTKPVFTGIVKVLLICH